MPFIPFKSNTVEPTEAGMWARMYHLFIYKREEYMEHYHKRRNIETAYSMIKGKSGAQGAPRAIRDRQTRRFARSWRTTHACSYKRCTPSTSSLYSRLATQRISLLGNVVLLIRWRFLFSLLPPPIFVQDSRLRFLVIYGYSPSVEGVGS